MTKQLKEYLEDKVLDATVEYDETLDQYEIQFKTARSVRTIFVKKSDIGTDYALVAAMLLVYFELDSRTDNDGNRCRIRLVDTDKVSIEIESVTSIGGTAICLTSGTTLDIEGGDPFYGVVMTFRRNKIVSRESLSTEIAKEIDEIVSDMNRYSA